MAKKEDGMKTALSLGILLAFLHTIGVVLRLVYPGITKFVLNMHFMDISYTMLPFNFANLIIGAVLAFIIGYAIGLIYSFIWSKI